MQHGRSETVPRPELGLLLACTRVRADEEDGAAIRTMLKDDIDWTLFAGWAISHGIAGMAGHKLTRVAPDMAPGDILDALAVNLEQTGRKNRLLFLELVSSIEALANAGIPAIAFRNPLLFVQAYGDLGFRACEHLDLLVRDSDIAATIATLRRRGYERKKQLTAWQLDFIRRLEGHEVLFNRARRTGAAVHTRLTPMNLALNIDHQGLWDRAQRTNVNGRTMLTLAPEDQLITLMLQDDWTIGWACDVARFIGSCPNLDWTAITERARAQGCLRMMLLMTLLVRTYVDASIPEAITAAAAADPNIGPMVRRIIAHWQTDEPAGFWSGHRISMDWLRLHDRAGPRARYMARSLFLPAPQHVARIPLPQRLTSVFAYVPLKIAHDVALLPLVRAYRNLRGQVDALRYALAEYQFALAAMPMPAEQRLRLKRHQAARAEAKRTLAESPNDPAAWQDLGEALVGLKKYEEAVACYDRVLGSVPDNATIWGKRASAARAGRTAILVDVDDERMPDPQDANGWARRAGFLSASQRFAEAAAASDRALAIEPKLLVAMRIGIRARLACCDWRQRAEDERRIAEGLQAGVLVVNPFSHRGISDSEAQNRLAARIWAKGIAQPSKPLWQGERYHHDRIRLAYLCAEYHDHPTARHIVGILEHHDKARFETAAISFGPSSADKLRERIEAACDRFIDVEAMTASEAAAIMREMEIDIAIDLNGHAGAGRPGILAQRPAPVQVSYLGNAGTTGAPFLDYIIADRTVIPDEHVRFYSEHVVFLPHSYQCNDSRRYLPQTGPSRVDADLPEAGFVYCCFNSNYKIAPPMFEVWMRLLSACPGSVLWLMAGDPYTIRNLRREAAARGVSPERLVFAPSLPVEDHLARLRLADLFLDTLPMNAHATAADALWAGLPVLTCLGNTFGGRVAASLLHAIGLPELVTASLAEYETQALALARDPQRLGLIKAKLMRNRDTEPLFDTARSTRALEAAYTAMAKRLHEGLAPASFAVDPAQESAS